MAKRAFALEHEGRTWTLKALSEHLGVRPDTLILRYVRGKRGADLLKPLEKDHPAWYRPYRPKSVTGVALCRKRSSLETV